MAAKSTASSAKEVIALLTDKKLSIATAESCTGGLVAAALSGVPGASETLYGGFITYSNPAKTKLIGVPSRMIRDHGAVSAQVARAMADGGRSTARADVCISVTGIAGPTGGSEKKPVGLVYLACATHEGTTVIERRFGAIGRDEVRARSVEAALELVIDTLTAPEQH
jgi:nicotinamide-nucleotide amidase